MVCASLCLFSVLCFLCFSVRRFVRARARTAGKRNTCMRVRDITLEVMPFFSFGCSQYVQIYVACTPPKLGFSKKNQNPQLYILKQNNISSNQLSSRFLGTDRMPVSLHHVFHLGEDQPWVTGKNKKFLRVCQSSSTSFLFGTNFQRSPEQPFSKMRVTRVLKNLSSVSLYFSRFRAHLFSVSWLHEW